MENVTEELLLSSRINDGNVDVRVSFTVVPGFKIGATVIQSQVYLSPMITHPVDGYGGNLGDHDATEGVGHKGVDVVEANIFPLVLLSSVAAGSGDFSDHDGRGSIDLPLLFITVRLAVPFGASTPLLSVD
ncbi:hypothetical protein GOBAR_AA31113 [Gossypium barbadense]|uniref:GIL1/IRKI C-terminal domain-containing protein n=1 Tax=Gossypium barbadense TaxID=3634 RepID=A0A2P5WEQ5_GOSBA|nr:hypothetical protein GOBAR_AA31113 [Gossypium barbadense]